MPQQMIWFFVSMAFSFIAWGIVTARYFWPELRVRQRAEALQPLLILHSFRFIGLAVLVPGVVSPELPPAFAHSAADLRKHSRIDEMIDITPCRYRKAECRRMPDFCRPPDEKTEKAISLSLNY